MKRVAVSWAGILAAALLLFAGPTLAAPAAQDLPQDEEKLLQFGNDNMNRGQWQQADRAYKAYLEKFPAGKHAETVHRQLGNLHMWYSSRRQEAREWYAKLCEKFPKSANYWHDRFQLANSYQYDNLRERAIEELGKIAKEAPDAHIRAQAIQQTWNLKGKYFQMSVNQSFTAGQEPSVHVQAHKVDQVEYRAWHIPFESLLPHLDKDDSGNLQQAIAKIGKDGRKLLKKWTATYDAKDNNWKNEQVKVPSTAAGVYIVEGEHEGVTMTVTLFSSRYGLVTKSAAGKLICFAQDRATSKPVEGVSLRVLNKEHPIQGTTGADGLFVSEAYKGGVIVGQKEGDLFTSQTHWYGRPEEMPLIYVTTDRPIYRPNQTVHFRLVYRAERGEKLEVKPGLKMVVEIHDPKGNKIYEKPHELNAFGSTGGEIVLGDEPALGEYMVYARPPAQANDYSWRWGHHIQNWGKFRVDEYRKPEYKVDVKFKKSPVLQGEDVEATIDAQYYFGSPVTEAEVQYTIYRRGHWYYWRCWDFYYDWYQDEDELEGHRARWWGHGEQVLQGSGKTDREGRLTVKFTSQKWEYDAVYTVVAQVTDLSRRMVEGDGSVKATRAEFGLALSLNKYVYKPGDRVHAKVRATTPDDKPVADVKVTLKAFDRHWKEGKQSDTLLYEGESRTDALGVADINFTPDREGGYLHLVAEARDSKENRVSAEHWLWLCGGGWYGEHINLNGIDIILDKKTYNAGDTAQALITTQHKNVTLLFTVEGKEIYQHQVVPVKGHAKLVEFKIERSYVPNAFIQVIAIKENEVIQKQRMVVVNPAERFVTVEIKPDKAQYRPRQKARYEIRTLGPDGKPVAAEVALGIVDDSIYALQEEYAPDIRKHFIHKRWPEVATSTSLYYHDWGRAENRKDEADAVGGLYAAPASAAPMEEKAAAKSRSSGDKEDGNKRQALATTEIRSNFADTMSWRTVTTDAEGRAVVEVDIPDNLTTWRATARAATADSRFGQETNSVITRKEVIVRLQTPRFFTQGDETVISAVAHNYLEGEREVKIEFAASGIEVEGDKERTVRIAAHGELRIDWKARVRLAGTAEITVKALSVEDSDAMQLKVPVLPHGALKWDSRGGTISDRVVEKIRVPEGSVKEATELVIVVSPTHASMVLDALDYLAGYPYGCVEQTMSRFLPTVVVSRALQKLGIEKKDLEKELPHMVAAGLQRLYNFQQQDGGWGWWQNDASNPWTTAYVVSGLAMAKDADHSVDPNVWSRGVGALHGHLARTKDRNERAYLLQALSLAGQRNESVRDELLGNLSELSPYGKALLALVLHKDGKDAGEVVAALAKQARGTGASAWFEGGKGGGWMDHNVEETAAALRAILKVEPKHALVPSLVHWLTLVREGNYWGSTKQTAMAVYAITDYVAITGDLNPDMTLSLTLNGDRVYSERVTRENWQKFDGMRKFKASQLREGENEIVIEKAGNGNPSWSIYLKHYAQAEDMKASGGGLQVERSYGRVLFEGGKRAVLPLRSGETVTSGDEIEVTLKVTADRNYEWLMIEDPYPSGFEAIRDHPAGPMVGKHGRHWSGPWNWWYSRKEFRDEKASIAVTHLNRGTQTVQYMLRAETPGQFHAMPATAFNMYHPGIGGNSDEFRISVRDKR